MLRQNPTLVGSLVFHNLTSLAKRSIVYGGRYITHQQKTMKRKIEKTLVAFGKSIQGKAPLQENGSMDVKKLQDMPETIQVKEDLKKLGVVSSKQLSEIGFLAAGMIIRF